MKSLYIGAKCLLIVPYTLLKLLFADPCNVSVYDPGLLKLGSDPFQSLLMSGFLCLVLCCVGRFFAVDHSSVKHVLPSIQKSEIYSESEQAVWLNS
jgi:hypothetical protein